jgi:hypothetical protein
VEVAETVAELEQRASSDETRRDYTGAFRSSTAARSCAAILCGSLYEKSGKVKIHSALEPPTYRRDPALTLDYHYSRGDVS